MYFPRKLRDEKFRNRSKVLIFLAWFFAFFPFLVTGTGMHNIHGYTCYTRKCTVLNLLDLKRKKPQTSDKMAIGAITVIFSLILLIVLNSLIYKKLFVSIILITFYIVIIRNLNIFIREYIIELYSKLIKNFFSIIRKN